MRLGDGAHLMCGESWVRFGASVEWRQVWYNNAMVKKSATETSPASRSKKSATARPMGLTWRQDLKWSLGVLVRLVAGVALLVGMAYLMTWILTLKQNMDDVAAAEAWIEEKPVLYEYSVLVIFSGLAVLAAVTLRPILTAAIGLAVAAGLGYANYQKLSYRDAPVLPEDLKMLESAGNLADFVDTGEVMQLIIGIVLLILGAWLLEHCLRKWLVPRWRERRWWEKIGLVPRVALTAGALSLATCVTWPVLTRQGYNEWLEGAEFLDWNQTVNYEDNGFVVGFLYNLGRMQVEEPEGYSEAEMQRIAEKYRAMKAADTGRVPLDEKVTNVVMILGESFYDPELYTQYFAHTGEDPIPNIRRVMEEYPSGYHYSTSYGGGTANVEFEVLTGLSNYWSRNTPYVNSLSKQDEVLSAATWTNLYNFEPWAMHAYDGTMYKRNIVYPIMGFERFIDENKMKYQEKELESKYVNDWSMYEEALEVLRESEEPQLVNLVTMQGHTPYGGANYPELNYRMTRYSNDLMEQHLQSLHMSDEYLGKFLAAIDELDEPTVVLWYGDHAAAYLYAYTDSTEQAERDLAYTIPYFIYANFELTSPYSAEEVAEMNEELGLSGLEAALSVAETRLGTESWDDLPTTSPNCLMNTVYDLLGVEKPALYYLVEEVCREAPILSRTYYWAEDRELQMTEALRDYELVNYDVLAGKHYWDGE